MIAPLLALSLSNSFTKVGAIAAFAALVGIALIAMLFFSHARELKSLREWVESSPERTAEFEQRMNAATTARIHRAVGQLARPVAPPAPAVRGAQAVNAAGPATQVAGATTAAVVQPPASELAAPPEGAQEPSPATPNGDVQPMPTGASGAAGEADEAAIGVHADAGDAAHAQPPHTEPPDTDPPHGEPLHGEPLHGEPTHGEPPHADLGGERAVAQHQGEEQPGSSAAEPREADQEAAGLALVTAASDEASPPERAAPIPAALADAAPAVPTRAGATPRAPAPPIPSASSFAAVPPGAPARPSSGAGGTRRPAGARPSAPPAPDRSAQRAAGRARPAPRGARRGRTGPPPGPPFLREERSPARATALVIGGVLAAVVVLAVALGAFSGGSANKGASSTPSSTPASTAPLVTRHKSAHTGATEVAATPAETDVVVLNGTETSGLAHRLSVNLQQSGYTQASASDASPGPHATSVVEYTSGHRTEAEHVAQTLGISEVQPLGSSSALAGSASVVVIAGSDQAAQTTSVP